MKNLSIKTTILNFIRKIFTLYPLELLLLKLYQTTNSNFILKLLPMNYLYPKPTIRKCVRNNINYSLDISSFSSWAIYWDIEHEKKYKKILYEEVSKGDIVFDIGAHVGQTCMNLANKVGPKGIVFGFEPHPETFQQLKDNHSLNNLPNLMTFNMGLGEEKGVYAMSEASPENAGMNFINTYNLKGCEIKVQLTTIDQFFKKQNLEALNMIKIDVEGFELSVLKGGVETILKYRPKMFIELDDRNLNRNGNSAHELVSFLNGLGYSCKNLKNGNLITENTNFQNCHYDILCSYQSK